MSAHWAWRYLGKPYERGAPGPDAYDCWTLLRAVLAERFGVEVPFVTVPEGSLRSQVRAFEGHPERSHWRVVAEPAEGDAVLLSHALHPHHAGIWIDVDGGGVLHAIEGMGVIFSGGLALRMQGWGKMEYYRHDSRT